MNRKKLVLTAAAAAALLGLSACTSDESGTASETTAAVETTATSENTTGTVEESSQHSEADVMFAQMMIPHHQQAIEMSDIILSKDDVPADVTALAEEIKAAQGPEIAQLTDWLEQWGEPLESEDMGGGHDMSQMDGMGGGSDMSEMEGMLSDEELQQLADAPGPEAAELFLNQMIAHHEGAVAMAEDEVANGTFQPAVDLAQTIIDTQQQEIDTMQQMLDAM